MCVRTHTHTTHITYHTYYIRNIHVCGLGSSVGIATHYGLDGTGSNPVGGKIFHPSRLALGPTQPPVKWVLGLSRGRGSWGMGLTPLPPSSAEVLERVELYLYSPQGPSWPTKRVKPMYIYCTNIHLNYKVTYLLHDMW